MRSDLSKLETLWGSVSDVSLRACCDFGFFGDGASRCRGAARFPSIRLGGFGASTIVGIAFQLSRFLNQNQQAPLKIPMTVYTERRCNLR